MGDNFWKFLKAYGICLINRPEEPDLDYLSDKSLRCIKLVFRNIDRKVSLKKDKPYLPSNYIICSTNSSTL